MEYVLIHPDDNVRVSLENGHKYAVCDIKKAEKLSNTAIRSALLRKIFQQAVTFIPII